MVVVESTRPPFLSPPLCLSLLACMRAVASSDSASARILPAEFKGGQAIVFGKDQCDRFAGLPHGKPLPAALFASLNLKRFILSRVCSSCLSRYFLSLVVSLSRLPVSVLSRVLCSFERSLLFFLIALLFFPSFFFFLCTPAFLSSRRLARSGQRNNR